MILLEPCTDVIVSAAARRSILVGGDHINSLKGSRKNFVLSSKFSDDLFLVIENCNKISTLHQWHRRRVDKLSAAARRSTKVCGGCATNCRRRQRGQTLKSAELLNSII